MNKLIDSPYGTGKAELKYEISEEVFRKEKLKARKYYYKCQKTGNEFTTNETGDLNAIQLFNLYRERKKILFPEQIIKMREGYGLSAAKMSEVLGFGANTYSNYEKGEIPNDSNSTLLNQAYNPVSFKSIILSKEDLFSEKQFTELTKRIENITNHNEARSLRDYLFPEGTKPNEFTGYRLPNYDKLANVVIYFLKDKYTYITRLNKYLFYADFLNFSVSGYSITGLNYEAIDMGPAPYSYKLLYGVLDAEKYIKYDNELKGNNEQSKYVPIKKFDKELFTEQELKNIETVYEKFRYKKTPQIIDISHEEEAWKKNRKSDGLISYKEYGFDLKGI